MSYYKVKSTKWYGKIWPPERRKIKLMQAILDYKTPEIQKELDKQMSDWLIYGLKPTYTKYKKEKL
jgi:hypothetical protein